MIEKKLCKISAFVDEDATRRLYMNAPSINTTDSAGANFLANLHLRQAALKTYFEPLGIDFSKCSELWTPDVDAYKQRVCYSGVYPFVGNILDIDKLGDPEDMTSSWYDFEETDFGFELCFSRNGPQLSIEFCVDFPWLFEPPIAIVRYINKTRLPEHWSPLRTPVKEGCSA